MKQFIQTALSVIIFLLITDASSFCKEMSQKNGKFSQSEIGSKTLYLVSFNTKNFLIKILGPEPDDGPRGDFLNDRASRLKVLSMLNGGYMRKFTPPEPLGLVRIEGKNISNSTDTWIGKGMFCVSNSRFLISNIDLTKANQFRSCIQSGPIFITKGKSKYTQQVDLKNGEKNLSEDVQDQSFVCSDDKGNLLLGFIKDINLIELSRYLASNNICENALRMSGGSTAGLVWNKKLYGNSRLRIHNVIAVFSK